ncbi:diaminopimelate epimerase [Corynebacterium sp. YSMAA1_1_F7]|uniref:diaminopimelate epimerase n=1 Tax=Corynebacterium sp. YSMAA1_1_F7 TaxID=3383590 RepID=UPI0038D0751D
MIDFIKAHGTENDFVILMDEATQVNLTEDRVRHLADRRVGIGGDGVIRIATGEALVGAGVLDRLPNGVHGDEWFMDYRNADGSLAEMCGNGVRAFAHVLCRQGKVTVGEQFGIGTRAGRKLVEVHEVTGDNLEHAIVSVDMGTPEVLGLSTAQVGDMKVAGLGVDMGNPHLAAVVPNLTAQKLQELPIDQQVQFDPKFFPAGVNLEVLTPLDDAGAVHMRVHERGVGETRSCGTGTVAAAVAALADAERATGTVTVHVPGGDVQVEVSEGGSVLRGPSAIVAWGQTVL